MSAIVSNVHLLRGSLDFCSPRPGAELRRVPCGGESPSVTGEKAKETLRIQLLLIEYLMCAKPCSRCRRHGSEQNEVFLLCGGDILVGDVLEQINR